jgi:GTPase SAR1 family protein
MSEELKNIPERQLKPFSVERFKPPQDVIGMVGFSQSGKSVFASLFTHFLHQTVKQLGVDGALEEGYETVRENMDWLLKKKQFPPATQPGTVRTIKILLTKKNFRTDKSILLQVNDMAGEPFSRLAEGNVADPVNFLLTYQTATGQGIGPYGFILYAKAFVITIDCSNYADWSTLQYDYCMLLRVIKEGRKKDKLNTPIAFVFTKCDLLPANSLGLSGDRLLEELPAVRAYIKQHFEPKKIVAIAVKIGVETDERGEPIKREDGGHIPKLPLDVPLEGFTNFVQWAFKWL